MASLCFCEDAENFFLRTNEAFWPKVTSLV